MASAWGKSWGAAWANAWGAISSAPDVLSDEDTVSAHHIKTRRKSTVNWQTLPLPKPARKTRPRKKRDADIFFLGQ